MFGKIAALMQKYKEIILYIVFGGLTTLVNWVCYSLLVSACGVNISNIISWIVSVLFAFVTNKLFVFESKSFSPMTFIKEAALFFGSRLLTGVIEIVGMPLLIYLGMDQSIFGIEKMLAKVVIGIIVIVLNYIFSKLLIFKKNNK